MKRKNKVYSIQSNAKWLLVILLPVLILNLVISVAIIFIVRQQSSQYLIDTTRLYIDQINDNFNSINRFMGWSAVNDQDLEYMMESVDLHKDDFPKRQKQVYSRFFEFQLASGSEYNFFLYCNDKDYFTNIAPMTFDFREYTSLKNEVTNLTGKNDLYQTYFRQWTTLTLDKQDYIVNIVPFHSLYLICIISADDFLTPLQELQLGSNGRVSLNSNHDEVLPDSREQASLKSLFKNQTILNENFSNASFHIQLIFDNFGVFEKIIIVQFLVLFFTFMIAVLAATIFFFMKNRILAPIGYFTENLKKLDENSEIIDFKSSDIIELEQVNIQFKNLISQIKRLKIDIYEKEIEHQQIQLDYMQLQIKPHFFLNCLTNIYSMAQMQITDDIERFCLSISSYFRYIFQNNSGFVSLESEINHVRDYLDILQTSFGEEFSYHIEQDPDTKNTKIPPLVLQTFIENAVKYAVTLNKNDHVSLIATSNNGVITIIITDTGTGFPTEILEKLQSGTPLERVDGTHIGIMNTIKRLSIVYGDRFHIAFENLADGGASVCLSIPDEKQELPKGEEFSNDSTSS